MKKIDIVNNLIKDLKSGKNVQKVLTKAFSYDTFKDDDILYLDWADSWQRAFVYELAHNCIYSRDFMVNKLKYELAFDTLLNPKRALLDKKRLNFIKQNLAIQFFNDDTSKKHDKPVSKDEAINLLDEAKASSFDKSGYKFCHQNFDDLDTSIQITYLVDKLNLVTDMPVHNNAEYEFKNQTLKDIARNLLTLSNSYPDGHEDEDMEGLADGDVDFINNIVDDKTKITKVRALSTEYDV